jgi:hypothetical protein
MLSKSCSFFSTINYVYNPDPYKPTSRNHGFLIFFFWGFFCRKLVGYWCQVLRFIGRVARRRDPKCGLRGGVGGSNPYLDIESGNGWLA